MTKISVILLQRVLSRTLKGRVILLFIYKINFAEYFYDESIMEGSDRTEFWRKEGKAKLKIELETAHFHIGI